MRKGLINVILLLILIFLPEQLSSQNRKEINYARELDFSINKTTNGGAISGFGFKYKLKSNGENFQGMGLEIANIKDPQESRIYMGYSNSVIFGKEKYLYPLRLYVFKENLIFTKASYKGVQVNGLVGIGPSFGIVAPYYVLMEYHDGSSYSEPFNLEKYLNSQNGSIAGPGYPLQGIFESSVVPGLNFRMGFNLEFGSFIWQSAGVEFGFMADLFSKKIALIPTTQNLNFFPAGYLTLYVGIRK